MADYGRIMEIRELMEFEGGGGYRIATDRTVIEFGISTCHQCCERWGYFSSDDDLGRFVGKEISDIELYSEKEGSYGIPEDAEDLECGGICFITVRLTDGDSFQLAVYNAHNGYYGHDIWVRVGDEGILADEI